MQMHASQKVVKETSVKSTAIDIERSYRAEDSMAARPERDLRTAKWATSLREDEWTVPVLVELIYFASSDDYCATEWPYDRIADRVRTIPPKLSPYEAVHGAIARLVECDARRPYGEGDVTWVERNLFGPLSRRPLVGYEDLDVSSFDGAFSLC
jgi:hypothetical protein